MDYLLTELMINRVPATGRVRPSMLLGTCESYWSSSVDSLEGEDEYHDPAWLAFLVVMLVNCQQRALLSLGFLLCRSFNKREGSECHDVGHGMWRDQLM